MGEMTPKSERHHTLVMILPQILNEILGELVLNFDNEGFEFEKREVRGMWVWELWGVG